MATVQTVAPHNAQAEAAILGSILIDPNHAINEVQNIVEPQHFYMQKHRWIYESFISLSRRGEPIDGLTLASELEARGRLEAVGGAVYIYQLINSVPSSVNVASYGRIVYDMWRKRQVLSLATDVAQLVQSDETDITAARDFIRARLDELTYRPGVAKQFQSFAELAPSLPEIQWLWHNWIPRGMITMLGAVPGAGKSMIALGLARRVMHGLPFPDGAMNNNSDGANVVYVDAEVVPQILKERTEMWEMDTSRLYLMLPNPNDMIDFGRIEYQERLRQMVDTVHPELVIIDSLSSVSSKGENNIEDVRAVLGFLNELAGTYQVGLVIIHHLRKRGQAVLPGIDLSIDDFRGSSHIMAMARSVLGLSVIQTQAEPDPNGPRKLAVLKSNLCAISKPIGCELVPLQPKGVMLKWDSHAPTPYKPPTKQEQCIDWLAGLLRESEHALSPKQVMSHARNEGYSRPLVYRAHAYWLERNKIRDTDGRQSPANKWEWVRLDEDSKLDGKR